MNRMPMPDRRVKLPNPIVEPASAVHPDAPSALTQIGADVLHEKGLTGEGVTVAVLDTGMDPKWAEYLEAKGLLAGAKSFVGEDPLNAGHPHGSHVVGIIHQVAPRAKILVVQVLGSDGSGSYRSLMDGADWAVGQGAMVLNMSLGGPASTDLNAFMLNLADQYGLFLAAAAGNDGCPAEPDTADNQSPGSSLGTCSVANMDYRTAQVAASSSCGESVDVSAPGVQILSWGLWSRGVQFMHMTGTSMAAPFVAGLAALLIDGPSSLKWVRKDLQTTAVNDTLIPDFKEGNGVVNGLGAFNKAIERNRRRRKRLTQEAPAEAPTEDNKSLWERLKWWLLAS